jgi:hypothetical protein
MRTWCLSSCLAPLILVALTCLPAPAPAPAPQPAPQPAPPTPLAARADVLGELVEFPRIAHAVYNRFGFKTLLAHRQPLLVISWRADDEVCSKQVVPAALQLQEQYGEDLVVLFIERSGLSQLDMLRFVAGRRWLCGDAMWTCEPLPHTDTGSTPSFVVTTVWHVAVLAGHPVTERADVEKAVELMVSERRHGKAGLPPEATKAWTALHEGQLLRALELGQAAVKRRARGEPGDAEAADVLDEQVRYLASDLSWSMTLTSEMVTAGAAAEALPLSESYAERLNDLGSEHPLRRQADSNRESLHHESTAGERKASEALLALKTTLCRKGPGAALEQAFRRLAKEHAGTHAAERALALADIAAPP